MAQAYSDDLRSRVIDAVLGGMPARRAAARYRVGVSTAIFWMKRFRETGERSARRQGQPKRSKLDRHEDFLLGLIDENIDITLEEMRRRLAEERDVSAGVGTLWRFFAVRRITVKKRRAMQTSKTATT